jgi:hypothetical protein
VAIGANAIYTIASSGKNCQILKCPLTSIEQSDCTVFIDNGENFYTDSTFNTKVTDVNNDAVTLASM